MNDDKTKTVEAAAKVAAAAVVAEGDAAAQVVQTAAAKAATFILSAAAKAAAERDRLEEHLRQTQKMEAVGQLAGGIAHDFNNLLTVISGFTELVLTTTESTDSRRADLLEVQKAAERAETLTRQLLAFSRRQVLQPRVLDVNAFIAGIQNLLRRTVREDIEVVVALRSVDPVRMDAGQLQQVLLNLTVNARDAMPTGGQLRFGTESVDVDEAFAREHPPMTPGRYVRLTISDTGVGMTRETQAKIFEPFFTTKPIGEGTGLGLATVYGIVKQSGGFVWVESHVGRGTSFAIDFPAVHAAVDPPLPAPATERMVNGSETVLLVEDESAVRQLAKQVLRSHGYAVLEGRDGNHGLEVAQQHRGPIHLLVTDVVMPGINGPDLVSRLLSTRPEMRVLYMTGYVDRDRVAALGTAPLLTKPFLPGALLRHVRDALDATSAS